MELIIIIIIIGSIGFITYEIKEARTNRLKKKIDEIRQNYPLAYRNYVSKNHITISNAKASVLETIVNQSTDYWKSEEKRLQEQEKKKQEIEREYNEIAKSYPNGLKKWTKLNSFSTHEKVVSNRYKIRDYEQAIKEAQEYDKWEEEQDEFKNECLEIAEETLPNFGKCYYDVPFTKLNEDGECVNGEYVVRQFFPGAYCLENDLDYSDFVSIKSNTKDIIRFKRKEVCWPKSVYEKINAFIMELAKKHPISIYLNANEEEWSSESLNFHYNGIIFGLGLVSEKVEIYNSAIYPILNGKPLTPKLKNRHIIIIDMQTENEQLKSVCKWITNNNKDKHPLITYISLLKGIDREEMIDLINNEKKKRKEEEEEEQEQLMYASLTTNAKEEDFEKAITDENGIIYSYDGQKVLGVSSPYITSCCIKSGTLVIIDEAFSDFWNEIEGNYLDQIIIPETIIKIGSNPFSGRVSKVICKSSKFEIIDDVLYDKNTSQKKLIQCFNRNANNGGKNNNKVIIPEGVNIIGEKSFYDCELESITIPNTVNKIEKNPFVSVNVIKNDPLEIICNSKYFVVDNYALYDIQTHTLISYFGKDKHFTINAGTRRIGELAFWGATTLESIYLPKSLEGFENYKYTFGYAWETLKKVLIPKGFKNKFEVLLPEHINILVEVPQEIPIEYKSDKEAIINLLRNNGINCFYHFTARRNLESIRRLGGLYSWFNMEENGNEIPCSGGDDLSHQLDMRYGLEDYVRLSFCNDHPMAYRLQQNGVSLVLLKIDIEVATWKETQFSDINAADSNHNRGGTLSDLRMVDFDAVKRNYVSRNDDDFKPHQAEVMVKTFIPAKHIINLDSPLPL